MRVTTESDLIAKEQLDSAIEIVGVQEILEDATISIYKIPNTWSASVLLVQPLKMAFYLIGKDEERLIDWSKSKTILEPSNSTVSFRDYFDGFIWLLAHECRHIEQYLNPRLQLDSHNREKDADQWAFKKLIEWQESNGDNN